MYVFHYPGITQDNYDQAGFYHTQKRDNSLINISVLATGNKVALPVQVSFDNLTWIDVVTVKIEDQGDVPNLVILGSGTPFFMGIAGIRLNLDEKNNAEYTLTCAEFYMAGQIIR